MAGWGVASYRLGLFWGCAGYFFSGRAVTVLVVIVYTVIALVGTVLAVTALVARPGAGC